MQINHDRRRSFVDNIRTYNDWEDDFPRCEGEMRQKFYQNNDLKLLGLAGSMKEAYEIVLKLVQMGYNSDCIYEMNDYLEKF